MSYRSAPEVLVTLALRLKGFGEVESISSVHELSLTTTEAVLAEMVTANKCVMRQVEGVEKFVLTPMGREEGEEFLARELEEAGVRDVVRSGYERFLALNPTMLQLCTDWQVIDNGSGDQKLNDHGDAAYDKEILDRLIELDTEVGEILQTLELVLKRFDNYSSRFTFALQKLQSGELEWLTKPIMPSYHTVWFELHEDLLATLGIDRASELSE
ncbi:MAG TPA: transcriptional regulator [Acidimicrobiaceae bacterium]|nr:transcriptional regulator [Acidimicrobiaceae bacterium]HAX06424.1 transcriptional regulator [Acidimicrobiaceae bacterium]|tara:strand:- start:153 stop:794 length:642 start_codon:yes stop_codon:yes gene_type:complete